ncbi:hypothetical protein DUI87_25304 [Hirundo rustica rustica]|uniref:Uncharacterized protein n=1 Tax=Hirundo rustica rustica TaxID=333673 RepID=A0A3M0JBW6_HIRRU|nr:hypothetical protein DUI87_25304 [Hirundo rustica rustica]
MRRQPLRREELMMSNQQPSDLQTHRALRRGAALQRGHGKHLDKACSAEPQQRQGLRSQHRTGLPSKYQLTPGFGIISKSRMQISHIIHDDNKQYQVPNQSLLDYTSCKTFRLKQEFTQSHKGQNRTDDRLEAKHTFGCFGTAETISPARQRIKSALQPSLCFIANFCTYVCDQLQASDIWAAVDPDVFRFDPSPEQPLLQVINLRGTNYHRQLNRVALMDWGDNKATLA